MHVDAAELARNNIAYRDPARYDELFVGDTTHADLVRALAAEHAPHATTLIDFGCGTARDIDQLSTTYQCAGVDLQPDLITYARTVRPHLELHVGDIRDTRLAAPPTSSPASATPSPTYPPMTTSPPPSPPSPPTPHQAVC